MLPEAALKLAIATAIVDKMPVETIVEKLFREDPERVIALYDDIACNHARAYEPPTRYGWAKDREKRRPLPKRKRLGLPIAAIAEETGIAASTLTALLEHHGFLELVPYGGSQKRRLVTDEAFQAELGHNVTPANRIGHLEGFNRSAVFPVFYREKLADILWCLDWEGIKEAVAGLPGKRERLAWLLEHHPYLPDGEIAALSGYTRRSVITGRQQAADRISQGSHIGKAPDGMKPDVPTKVAA